MSNRAVKQPIDSSSPRSPERSSLQASTRSGAESSTAASQRSYSSLDDTSTYVNSSHGRTSRDNAAGQDSGEPDGERSFRRHRPKSSGGFMLESSFDTAFDRSSRQDENGRSSEKGASEGKSSIMSKVGSWRRRRNGKSKPVKSSPLSIANPNSPSGETSTFQTQDSSPPTRPSANRDVLSPQVKTNDKQRMSADTIGSDPLHIVNLALSLSESRRKISEKNRVVSYEQEGGTTSRLEAQPAHLRGNSGQSTERGQSLDLPDSFSLPHSGASRGDFRASQNELSNGQLLYGSDKAETDPATPSEATLARAKKARDTFELAFQHRRLIGLLPPIQASNGRAARHHRPSSSTSQIFDDAKGDIELHQGRVYNPLQCIRDRKIRAREKAVLDLEAQGWTDAQAVTLWIDDLETKSLGSSHLRSMEKGVALSKTPYNSGSETLANASRIASMHTDRHNRSGNDWMVEPSELLANTYWTQQGNNKSLLEDQDGNKLYPYSPQKDTSKAARSLLQDEHSPPEERSRMSFESKRASLNDFKFVPVSDQIQPASKRNRNIKRSSQTKAGRAHRYRASASNIRSKLTRSRSSSSSRSDPLQRASPPRSNLGTRSRSSLNKADETYNLESRMLEAQMLQMLEKETNNGGSDNIVGSAEDSFEISLKNKPTQANNQKEMPASSRKQSRDSGKDESASSSLRRIGGSLPHFKRSSISSDRFRRSRMSMDELDVTAPSSPDPSRALSRSKSSLGDLIPSISLNLSAPSSREVSPTRKSKPTPLGPAFAPSKVEKLDEAGNISETDFATADLDRRPTQPSRQPTVSPQSIKTNDSTLLSKQTSPVESMEKASKGHKRSDSRWRRSEREDKEPEVSRIRGIFKGGRIEEIVKSEVSRVGDFIWKKEPPAAPRQMSPASSHDSDTTQSDDDVFYDTTREELSRSSTRHKADENVATSSRSRYLPSLPSFRSTFGPPLSDPKIVNGPDHISRQQSQREKQRSPRFDRLAPPKISVDSPPDNKTSDTPPAPSSRRKSAAPRIEKRKNSYAANDRKHEPMPNANLNNVRNADLRLNKMLMEDVVGIPGLGGISGIAGLPVTALTSVTARDSSRSRRPSRDVSTSPQRQWSVSEQPGYNINMPASRREIARVKALLICSGVKAKEIQRLSNEKRPVQSVTLTNRLGLPLPEVARLKQHVYKAGLIEHDIDLSAQMFDKTAAHLRNVVISDLFDQIKMIQDRFNSKLMPTARASGDDADAFSTELTSTRTLAIKQLNDSVYAMARRRRRRLKWISRSGFVLLEWLLLGMMWWVWLIFVIIRLVRGTFRGFVSFLRWLFWL